MRKATLCVTLLLLASLHAVAQDRSTPEATVRSFLAAFGQGDLKQAAACVKGVKTSPADLEDLSQMVKKDPAEFTLTDAKTTLNGTSATVTGHVSAKSKREAKAQTISTQVNLTSAGGTWQIVPDATKARDDKNPDLVNALAYMLTDARTMMLQAHDSAEATVCLSNVKQLCTGALMFLEDYNEVFKLKAATYQKSLLPYVKNETLLFKCPADKSGNASYAFNAYLAGVALAKIRTPATMVLIYEGANGKLNFRHGGRAAVGFADGHAKLVNAVGAKQLRWKP